MEYLKKALISATTTFVPAEPRTADRKQADGP